jgi:hypothetical protein
VSRYDHAARRKARRHRKADRGVWVYIAAPELAVAGRAADQGDVYYRVWGTPRGGAYVRFYREP